MSDITPTSDIRLLDDAAMAARLAELDAAEDTPETPAPEAKPSEEAAPDAEPEKVVDDQADQDEDPAASTDTDEGDKATKGRIADVQKARQRAQEAERKAQDAEQRAQEVQRQLADLQRQKQQGDLQAEYERLYDEVGPEAAEQFRQNVAQRDQEARQQQANANAALERIQMSREVALDMYPDYEAQEAKVIEKYGLQEAQRLAARHPNPAKWAYEEGKSIQTPAEREAAIKAEARKIADAEIQAALKKQSTPPPGRKSIGDLSSTRGSGVQKAPSEMSDAELKAHEADLLAHWSD